MHKSRSTRHDFPRTALVAAAILAGAALAWTLVGVSALVKYPTDLDVNPRYEGTFSLHVDPTTAAPLRPAGAAADDRPADTRRR